MMDHKEILLIITDLVKKVQTNRDIYISIFITNENVGINVYPNEESEDE